MYENTFIAMTVAQNFILLYTFKALKGLSKNNLYSTILYYTLFHVLNF